MERLQIWIERAGRAPMRGPSYPVEVEDLCFAEAERLDKKFQSALVRGPGGDIVWPVVAGDKEEGQ